MLSNLLQWNSLKTDVFQDFCVELFSKYNPAQKEKKNKEGDKATETQGVSKCERNQENFAEEKGKWKEQDTKRKMAINFAFKFL